jgi:hypothetical protein
VDCSSSAKEINVSFPGSDIEPVVLTVYTDKYERAPGAASSNRVPDFDLTYGGSILPPAVALVDDIKSMLEQEVHERPVNMILELNGEPLSVAELLIDAALGSSVIDQVREGRGHFSVTIANEVDITVVEQNRQRHTISVAPEAWTVQLLQLAIEELTTVETHQQTLELVVGLVHFLTLSWDVSSTTWPAVCALWRP